MNFSENNLACQLKNVTRYYGMRKVLDDININISKNLIHGFLGPNGAGKTTSLKILAGLLPSHSGEVRVFDHSISDREYRAKNIGILLERPMFYDYLTAQEHLSFIGKLWKIKNLNKRVGEVLSILNIEQWRDRRIEHLSQGIRKRLGLAQAILHDPSVIILDEPTLSLDPHSIVEFRALLKSLKEHHTIIFSTHQLHEVEVLCEEVSVIHQGKILYSGLYNELPHLLKLSKNWTLITNGSLTSQNIKEIENTFGTVVKEISNPMDKRSHYQFKIDDYHLAQDILKHLVQNGLNVSEFFSERQSLEKLFLGLTQGGVDDQSISIKESDNNGPL